MKGFMKDDKFHPIKKHEKKGTRKKRLNYNDPELRDNAGIDLSKEKIVNGFRMKRDGKAVNVSHFGISEKLGVPVDGVVGTYVTGRGSNYKIVGYMHGQTFSEESVKHVDPQIKTYEFIVTKDPESPTPRIYASDDSLAKTIAKDYLKKGVDFKMFRIERKVHPVS